MAMDKNSQTVPYLHTLTEGIETIWQEELFTDIEISVGQKTFKCHKIILSSLSAYFSAMFKSGMRESSEGRIHLHEIDAQVFEVLLGYLYSGSAKIRKENVSDLLQVAVMFQVKCLQEQCETYLEKELGPDNCLDVWRLASSYGCVALEKKSWSNILEYFTTLAMQEEFCQIPIDNLITIINANDLNTNSEEAVCEAVLKWVMTNEEERLHELGRLFQYIRFPLTRMEYIEKLNNHNLVLKSEDAQSILKSMLSILTSPESDFHELDIKHMAEKSRQFHHRHEEMMCVIGTRSRHPNPQTTEIKCFSYRRDADYSMAALPTEPGACFAVCKHKNDVFVSGGYHGESLFLKFLVCENSWQFCSPLLEGRWGHAMVAVGEYIYIIGGNTKVSQTLSSIECYDTKRNKCELVGGLKLPVSFMPVAVIGHRIYIFGGKMHGGSLSRQIQCFDTKKKNCMLLGHIPPIASTASRVTVLDDVIYIFYRHGDIIQYKENSEAVVIGNMPNFDHFGIVTYQGQILIVGSQSNQCKTVMFNPQTKEMVPYNRTMKAALCNFYCMSIVISKQYIKPDNKNVEVVIE